MPFKANDPNINREGRPRMTEAEKEASRLKKIAQERLIEEYTAGLRASLPAIQPVLIEMATSGDIQAIKEIHEQAIGKPKGIDLTTGGEKISLSISEVIANKNNL